MVNVSGMYIFWLYQPAVHAVRKDVTTAHKQAWIATANMLYLWSGHRLHSEADRIPTDPGLAKLHRAYVAITSDLGWEFWFY